MSRRSTASTAARVAAVAALCLAATVAAVPANADPAGDASSAARVRGNAGATLTADFPGFEGDAVRFEVDARTDVNSAPAHGKGHFHVTHHRPDGRLVADFEGDIGCLAVGGGTAIATGVVTKGEVPWFPGTEVVGTKVSITVQDNGRADRLGWIWGAFGAPVSDCQGTVPFMRTSSGGGFTVRG
ncbi:hypothetical protein ACFVVX_24835 [Kitasatospora sp. NPDC058170]|uniref:hypothetical protein n=1 Tax=Kitasatospora sp. NPDC058170 TaxID=3346364 RepID=UPI0036D960E5